MDKKETKRFDKLYQRHLQMLKLQGKSEKTQDAYARAIRRLRDQVFKERYPQPYPQKDISFINRSVYKSGLFNNRIRSWFASLSRSILIR